MLCPFSQVNSKFKLKFSIKLLFLGTDLNNSFGFAEFAVDISGFAHHFIRETVRLTIIIFRVNSPKLFHDNFFSKVLRFIEAAGGYKGKKFRPSKCLV